MFKDVKIPFEQDVDMVKFRVGWWFKYIVKGSKDPITLILLSIAERCTDVKKTKLPNPEESILPEPESLKFNVDGSARGSQGQTGVGGGGCCEIAVARFCVCLPNMLGFNTVFRLRFMLLLKPIFFVCLDLS